MAQKKKTVAKTKSVKSASPAKKAVTKQPDLRAARHSPDKSPSGKTGAAKPLGAKSTLAKPSASKSSSASKANVTSKKAPVASHATSKVVPTTAAPVAKPQAASQASSKSAVAKAPAQAIAPKAAASKPLAEKVISTAKTAVAAPAPVKPKAAAPVFAPAAKKSADANPMAAKTPQAAPTAHSAITAPKAPAAQPVRPVPAALAKSNAGQKLTAPASTTAPQTPKALAEKAAAARQMIAQQALAQPKKPVSTRHGFKTNEFIVYPAHGVGRIVGIEEQEIAGISLELFVITFEKEKLTLRVPTGKLESVGMRKLADDGIVKRAMEILKGRARIKRTMWSRRAQEYVAKINSGDLISIAEVVRDLYRSEAQPEQSYSERQLYEDALDRMAREIAAVEKLDDRGAVQLITDVLSKSARGRRLAEDGGSDTEIQAA